MGGANSGREATSSRAPVQPGLCPAKRQKPLPGELPSGCGRVFCRLGRHGPRRIPGRRRSAGSCSQDPTALNPFCPSLYVLPDITAVSHSLPRIGFRTSRAVPSATTVAGPPSRMLWSSVVCISVAQGACVWPCSTARVASRPATAADSGPSWLRLWHL